MLPTLRLALCASLSLLKCTDAFAMLRPAMPAAARQLAVKPAYGSICGSHGALQLRRRRVLTQWAMQTQLDEQPAPAKAEPKVICVEGLCAIQEEPAELSGVDYWFPRGLFLACCVAYGTNFALGRSMNEALAPSVVSGLRFSLAALVLSPFLKDLKKELIKDSVLMSLFIAAGYIGQSISLQTIEAGKAGFICSLSVIVCPILEIFFDNKKISAGLIAAVVLSVAGVATLELTGDTAPAIGDLFALAQPLGFGVGYYLTEKMMKDNPTMTIPITAVQTAVVGACALVWMVGEGAGGGHLIDGSMFAGLLSNPKVALSLLWTGVMTTALTRLGETKALAGISSSEAAVLMTTEPIWAALWGSVLMGEVVGPTAYIGGGLIMAGCAANIIDPVKAGDAIVEIYRQGSAAIENFRQASFGGNDTSDDDSEFKGNYRQGSFLIEKEPVEVEEVCENTSLVQKINEKEELN